MLMEQIDVYNNIMNLRAIKNNIMDIIIVAMCL